MKSARAIDPSMLGPSAQRQIQNVCFAEAVRDQIRSQKKSKRQQKSKRHPEQDFQIHVVTTILRPLHAAGLLVYAAFSNGFKRTATEAKIAKAMGQRAGAWDLFIAAQGTVFGLELKSATGRLSCNQFEFAAQTRIFGFRTYVCRTDADVMNALAAEGIVP